MDNKPGTVREMALFAGAGGGILGGHLLGWKTVCAVEWGPYPASVLVARQNDGILPPFPIWDDVQTFDGKPWRGLVDVVSGGFPCQDISSAGKGAGITGARSGMWKHMARIINEVRPRFAFVENSPMLVGRGAAMVIGDLAEMGYDSQWCIVSASDLGAPHQRDRFWLVAHSQHSGHPNTISGIDGKTSGVQEENWPVRSGRRLPVRAGGVVKRWTADRLCDKGDLAYASGSGDQVGNTNDYGSSELRKQKDETGGYGGSPTKITQSARSGEQYAELADTSQLQCDVCQNNARIRMESGQVSESGNDGWTQNMADTNSPQRQGNERTIRGAQERTDISEPSWWASEPSVG